MDDATGSAAPELVRKTVRILVLDASDDSPIARARVETFEGAARARVTGEDGSCELPAFASDDGILRLLVEAERHFHKRAHWLTHDELAIRLDPATELFGRVLEQGT